MSDWKWSSATKEAGTDGWFAHMIQRRELKSRCSSLPIKHTHTYIHTATCSTFDVLADQSYRSAPVIDYGG